MCGRGLRRVPHPTRFRSDLRGRGDGSYGYSDAILRHDTYGYPQHLETFDPYGLEECECIPHQKGQGTTSPQRSK